MALTDTPHAGHNSGDPFAKLFADITDRLAAFGQGATVWEQRAELDEALAERANDFLTGLTTLQGEAEKARKAEKQPHLEAGRDVDAKWGKLTDRIAKIKALVKPKLKAFLDAKAERERIAREEAEQERRDAEAAAEAARADAINATDVNARLDAEEAAAEQQRLAEEAAERARAKGPTRVGSATGLGNNRGFRTVYRARIASLAQALNHFKQNAELHELLITLAEREARGAPVIDGVKQLPVIPGIEFNAEKVI